MNELVPNCSPNPKLLFVTKVVFSWKIRLLYGEVSR